MLKDDYHDITSCSDHVSVLLFKIVAARLALSQHGLCAVWSVSRQLLSLSAPLRQAALSRQETPSPPLTYIHTLIILTLTGILLDNNIEHPTAHPQDHPNRHTPLL